MKILSIETSCDETALTILECNGDDTAATFSVLSNALLSQIEVHKKYGGVFPALAKREHAKNLMPLLESVLEEAGLLHESTQYIDESIKKETIALLERELELSSAFFELISQIEVPDIDAIAVTHGPGLEPALWVGVNFARALSAVWNKPLIGVNHMEGHLLAGLVTYGEDKKTLHIENSEFPLLALLISGGHTELINSPALLQYERIGQTLDDAVGEAFDKVARMLALPYPGGPQISKLAELARTEGLTSDIKLPRPMLHDDTCNFSFSGLKTSVLYLLKKKENVTDEEKKQISHEFENAVTEVLYAKTVKALEQTGAKRLVLGGGVSANIHIRRVFEEKIGTDFPHVSLSIPSPELTSDNAIMIGISAFYRAKRGLYADRSTLKAEGNLAL